MYKKSHYNKNLKTYARQLRNESTLGEVILWSKVLRAKKLHGFQFNRQYIIDNCIVDFICRELKLIIEIDGYSHNFKYDEDLKRDSNMRNLGYSIMRFTEQQVRYDLDNVAEAIENEILRLKEKIDR